MKYLFKSLIIIIILFFVLKAAVYMLDNEHEVEYNIGNFDVQEHFKLEKGQHIYSYKIKNEDFEITFDINKNFKKTSKTI